MAQPVYRMGYYERMSSYEKTAVSWWGLKDAMLYFPHVIPFGAGFDLLVDAVWARKARDYVVAQNLAKAIETDLIPPELRSKEFFEDLNSVTKAAVPFITDEVNSCGTQ